MTCHDFWIAWQARLDDRSPTLWAEPDSRLVAHAAACRACRDQSARFQALEQALALAGPPPTVAPERTEQILASLRLPHSSHATSPWSRARPLATEVRIRSGLAAAAVLIGLWLVPRPGTPPSLGRPPAAPPGPSLVLAPVSFRPLSETIAEATVVSLDLARETSAPAARLGRKLLGSATPDPTRSESDLIDVAESDAEEPGLWRSVGDRMATGVRPLSEPARRAFSFLTPPSALAQVSEQERGL